MVKIFKGLTKTILVGVVAIAIVSLLLCFYSITPVHIENTMGNTDYVWPAGAVWVKMTEGIAWGKYDENGFNNLSVVDKPDVIVLGSSHMEASNVMQDENVAYLLSRKLCSEYSVYNMGISGHNFAKVCQYLPNNMELYDIAPKVTIIETSTVTISSQNVEEVLNSSVEHTPSYSSGLIGALQKIPFFRLVYQQVEGGLLDMFMPDSNSDTGESIASEESTKKVNVEYNAYNDMFSYLSDIEAKYETEIIIFYHPTETILEEGTVSYGINNEYFDTFATYADKYNITFVDMTDPFEEMFYSEQHVAHGFLTGKLGVGHLNAYGHAAIAEELYDVVIKLEEDGTLCK